MTPAHPDAPSDAHSNDIGLTSALRHAPLVVALVVLGFHVAPLFREVTSWARQWDARYFWFVLEVDRTTILQHHQLPLWNPYYCGGASQLANAQSSSFSPFNLFPLLLGMPLGYRVGYACGLLTALFSLRAFARTLGLGEAGATLAGAGYAVCGALAQHMGGGHWAWMGFALHPLLLRSLHLAVRGRREHVVWGGCALALIVLHAPIYSMAFGLVALGVYALLLALAAGPDGRRPWLPALACAAGILAIGLGLGAFRLFPIAELVRAHPRKVNDWDTMGLVDLFVTFGVRHSGRRFGEHQYVFPEYGNYFGLVGVGLVLVGAVLVIRRRRRLWPLLAAAGIFLLFELGNQPPLPWWLLKHLPIYSGLRVPSRFTVVAGMFMCLLAGVAVDELGAAPLACERGWRRPRAVGWAVLALAVGYLFDAASFNRLQWDQTIGTPPPRDPRAASFHQVPGDRGRMMAFPRANEGTLSCFEETPLPISPLLRGNLPADEYLADPSAGHVQRLRWSPNEIVLDVDVARPATVLVNQNFDPGWRASGAEVVNEGGLLAARVPAGRGTVTFVYRPRSFVVGGVISLLTLLGALAYLIFRRRRAKSPPMSARSANVPTIADGRSLEPETSRQDASGTSRNASRGVGGTPGAPTSSRPMSSTSNAQRETKRSPSAAASDGERRSTLAPH